MIWISGMLHIGWGVPPLECWQVARPLGHVDLPGRQEVLEVLERTGWASVSLMVIEIKLLLLCPMTLQSLKAKFIFCIVCCCTYGLVVIEIKLLLQLAYNRPTQGPICNNKLWHCSLIFQSSEFYTCLLQHGVSLCLSDINLIPMPFSRQ